MGRNKDNWLSFIGLRRQGEAHLSLNPFTLRFTDNMAPHEPSFLEDYYARSVGPYRLALVLASIFYGGFALLDAAIVPEIKLELWTIRFLLVIPMLLLVFGLTYLRGFSKYMQTSIAIIFFLTGFGIILMVVYTSTVNNYTYYAGLILIFIFGYTFSRARFIYATIAGWSVVLAYEVASVLFVDAPASILGNNNAFFIGANIIGMVVCYTIEYSARKDFIMRMLLEEEESKVRAANDELEKRVQQRTSQLTKVNKNLKKEIEMRKHYQDEQAKLEAQLLQLQKMETIGTLAGGIAHDFNNILTPILGYTEMALEELDENSNLHYDIEQINHAALRGKDLVQQILTFSRQVDVERKPLQMHLVVKDILNLIRASFPSNIEIRQQLDPLCGTVMADSTQLHQIIMNLCTNSYHAMMEKGGILDVKLNLTEVDPKFDKSLSSLTKGTYVAVTVADTGHGMDKLTLERIFEPFFTKKEVGVGSGLGLAVVHGIVKSYKGTITVNSRVGKGTTVKIYLPQHSADPEAKVKPASKTMKGTEKILFVDDEEEITFMGKKMLESLGYDVNVQTESNRALEEFKENSEEYDLLVTDQTMPNLMGTELAEMFRKIKPGLKVIIITGFSDSITRETAEKFGINEILYKPLVLSEFSKVIREVLDGKVPEKA